MNASVCADGARLVSLDGTIIPLRVDHWLGLPSDDERRVLARVLPPVLDVGCGPARHALALAQRGVVALGIDVAPAAISVARDRGAPALLRCVFDRCPAEGRWGTVLLLDGNLGIGGDALALLRRARELLHRRGRVLVEAEPPEARSRTVVARVERGGDTSEWFTWSLVAATDLPRLGAHAGFDVEDLWSEGERWFASLRSQ